MLDLKHIKTRKQLRNYYTSLLPRIREIAEAHGYAVGVHGSLERDLDLIVSPWVDNVKKPESLLMALEEEFVGYRATRAARKEWWAEKPHGRRAQVIHLGYIGSHFTKHGDSKGRGCAYIDLSFVGNNK